MIIVRLAGGLGNQMFKYATGKRLSLARGDELKLDISRLSDSSYRKYQLGSFDIREEIASEQEIRKLKYGSFTTWDFLHFRPWIGVRFLPPTFYTERSVRFDPLVLDLDDNVYLQGRLQCEKYFLDMADEIAMRFRIKDMSARAREFALEMEGCESVSIHVRRGDYVSNPGFSRQYGFIGPEYYEECVRRILESGGEPRFFVFSDEPGWVRTNMDFPDGTQYVTPDGLNSDAEELYLMSFCKKHITANSTFSWWGAWLGKNPEKVIYTPRRWFLSDEKDTSGLIPDSWVKV